MKFLFDKGEEEIKQKISINCEFQCDLSMLDVNFDVSCRLCLSNNQELMSIYNGNMLELINLHLKISVCLFLYLHFFLKHFHTIFTGFIQL